MSQTGGAFSGSGSDAEPNLVPLLDLVLQLVMFFMICANFVMEQVDQTVFLPFAQKAVPLTETGSDIVFLNINTEGHLQVIGRPLPLKTDAEIHVYLQQVHDDAKRLEAAKLKRKGMDPALAKADTLVIVRAHRDAEFASVYRVMRKCQEVGLARIQLRARTMQGQGG